MIAALRLLQGGKCAICFREMTRGVHTLHTVECADHCHVRGEPRGLLCKVCNTALGYYEKQQYLVGLRIEPYDRYLANTPVSRVKPLLEAAGLKVVPIDSPANAGAFTPADKPALLTEGAEVKPRRRQ